MAAVGVGDALDVVGKIPWSSDDMEQFGDVL